MKAIALAIALLAACGDNLEPGGADAALPSCADVGCPDLALCTADGVCTCNASGEPVMCQRVALPPSEMVPDECLGDGCP